MYIEDRLFSETSGEVKYYSVAMTEEEYELYSEFLEEREYASVRGMKKASNKIIDAMVNKDKKALGKATAVINRQGLNVNSLKKLNNPNYDKVLKSGFNKIQKKTGAEFDKNLAISKTKELGATMAKQNIARGGKPLMKLKDIPL